VIRGRNSFSTGFVRGVTTPQLLPTGVWPPGQHTPDDVSWLAGQHAPSRAGHSPKEQRRGLVGVAVGVHASSPANARRGANPGAHVVLGATRMFAARWQPTPAETNPLGQHEPSLVIAAGAQHCPCEVPTWPEGQNSQNIPSGTMFGGHMDKQLPSDWAICARGQPQLPSDCGNVL